MTKTSSEPSGLDFDPATAITHLQAADPRLGRFITQAGEFDLRVKSGSSVFGMLAEAVVYQQLTAKAAATIFSRVCALFPNGTPHPQPADILGASEDQLRSAGLSRAKALSLLDLAQRAEDGRLPTLAQVRQMADEEVVGQLSSVRGVGRWTAEMFLIFRLGRPDVLPVDDYGIRKGFARIYGNADLPDKPALREAGERWRPYRTVASWYLWLAVELARSDS